MALNPKAYRERCSKCDRLVTPTIIERKTLDYTCGCWHDWRVTILVTQRARPQRWRRVTERQQQLQKRQRRTN